MRSWATVLLLLVSIAPRAHGGGFQIQEQSARALGTAYVGEAAVAQDPTTIFFNPAGITRLSGTQAAASGSVILLDANFKNDRSIVNPTVGGGLLRGDPTQDAGPVGLVGSSFITQEIGERWAVGLGVTAPFGLRTNYDRNWVGRYSAVLSQLATYDFNPVFAVRVGHGVSIGGGLDLQYARAELTNMLDLGTICAINAPRLGQPASVCPAIGLAPQSVDGFVRIKGDSIGIGGNLGFLWELDSNTRFGVGWRSRVDQTLKGTAQFSIPQKAEILRQQSGALKNTGGQADLNLPDVVRIGFFHRFSEQWAIMGGADWTHWARFQDLTFEFDNPNQPTIVQPQNWRDTWRGGVAVAFSPISRLALRLGSAYDQTPVPNAKLRNPRIPDSDRVWLTTGVGYQATDSIRVDVGYAHIFAPGTTRIDNPDPVSGDVVRGTYQGQANIVGLQFSMRLD